MRAPLLYETGANGWKVRRCGWTDEIVDAINSEGIHYFASLVRECRGSVVQLVSGTLYRDRRSAP